MSILKKKKKTKKKKKKKNNKNYEYSKLRKQQPPRNGVFDIK